MTKFERLFNRVSGNLSLITVNMKSGEYLL